MLDCWIDDDLDLEIFMEGLKGTEMYNQCFIGTNDLNG